MWAGKKKKQARISDKMSEGTGQKKNRLKSLPWLILLWATKYEKTKKLLLDPSPDPRIRFSKFFLLFSIADF